MRIKKYIRTTLSKLNIPIYLMHNPNSNDQTYVVYDITSENHKSITSEGKESIKYTILIRIYSKKDFDDLADELNDLLVDNGFDRRSSAELYDNEMNYYVKSIYYNYIYWK